MTLKNKYLIKGNNFANLVSQYIDVIDNKLNMPRIEFLLIMLRLLSKIYSAGAELPIVEGKNEELDIDEIFNTKNENLSKETKLSFKRKERIEHLMGKYDRYIHVFDPIEKGEKENPIEYCISGDLSEIYDDFIRGLELWESNDPIEKEEAILQWQIHFDMHWGHHLIITLRLIHRHIEEFFYEYDDDDYYEIRYKYI